MWGSACPTSLSYFSCPAGCARSAEHGHNRARNNSCGVRAHGGGRGRRSKLQLAALFRCCKNSNARGQGKRGGVRETKHHPGPKSSDCQAAQTAAASSAFPLGRCQVHAPHQGKESEARFRTRTRGPDTRVSLSTSGRRAAGRAGGQHVAVAGAQAALGLRWGGRVLTLTSLPRRPSAGLHMRPCYF